MSPEIKSSGWIRKDGSTPAARHAPDEHVSPALDPETVARRRAAQVESNDLLSMLLHARDSETGAGMTDLQLRDELATLLLAGSETTAMALTWTLYLLSQNPTATTRLQDELRTALAGGGKTPQHSEIAERVGYDGRIETPLDSVGHLSVDQPMVVSKGRHSAYNVVVETDVEDVSRQTFAARTNVLVHPGNAVADFFNTVPWMRAPV